LCPHRLDHIPTLEAAERFELSSSEVEPAGLQPGESVASASVPRGIENWSLTSLRQRLVKTGRRLVKHGTYYWLLLAGGRLNRRRFGAMLGRIGLRRVPTGSMDGWSSAAELVCSGLGEGEVLQSGGISGNFGGVGSDLGPLGAVRMQIVSHYRRTAIFLNQKAPKCYSPQRSQASHSS
jgi:hypothetical protein